MPDDTSVEPNSLQAPATVPQLANTRPASAPIVLAAADLAVLAPPGYEVLDELGRGGMGVVYKARQAALNRTVALKMILAGSHAQPEEVVRFLREAEAAASLRHPNIVQVYEVGRHDGRPYIVLEYVEGGSLAERARDPLPPREAAALMEPVARGVAFAHANGIVHRDLKPENVLLQNAESGSSESALRDPQSAIPKVTDFGLAKTLDSDDALTATGAIMGTPSYMAPEQASGDSKRVGPAADVWALGAVLYRLLTGRPPFAAPTPFDTIQLVLTADPPSPSDLVPKLPRDLETICLKCLRKDPAHRYATADAVADDLRRFLAGETIRARPVGSAERAWKWAKRNRGPTVWAAGVFLALAAGAGVAAWQAVEATRARAAAVAEATRAGEAEQHERNARTEAERQEATATAVKDFLKEVLAQTTAEKQAAPDRAVNRQLTIKEAMDHAAKQIGGRFAGQPLVAAELRTVIGERYYQLGAYAESEAQHAAALDLRTKTLGPDHPATLDSLTNLGTIYETRGKHAEAERMLVRAVAGNEAVRGSDHPGTLTAATNLAALYFAQGKFAAAEPLLTRSLTASEKANGPDHPDTYQDLINLGRVYEAQGKYAEAEPLLTRAAAGCLKTHGPEHPDTLAARNNLALVYLGQKRYAEAEDLFTAVLSVAEKVLGPDHPNALTAVHNVARVLCAQKRYAEAEPRLRRLLAGREKYLPDSWVTPFVQSWLGEVLIEREKYAEAAPLLLAGYRGLTETAAALPERDRPVRLREAADRLTRLYEATNKPAEAEKWRAQAAKHR